jgi:5-methylcytosine-specific restriction endonuclease McrA
MFPARPSNRGRAKCLAPFYLEVIMGIHKARVERYEQYREYKEQGHTLKEVAERFGISYATAFNACKGIAPQKAKVNTSNRKNQYTCQSFDREQNAIRTIEERTPGFEYAGGFTHCDGDVLLRCKKCGSLLRRSMISVRKKAVSCETCKSIELAERKHQSQLAKDEKARAKQEWHNEVARRNEAKRMELAERREARRHACPICGKETTNKVCCSMECSNKRHNRVKENRRRIKIDGVLIDNDITLQALFNRDNGVCHICGGVCDWGDKRESNGTVICGNNYPSIDHVKPLSLGGLHEWGNVRLAHRLCNSKKSNRYIPLGRTS